MRSLLRPALVALSLLLALWSIGLYWSWQSEQARLARLLDDVDAESYLPGLGVTVRRANDPLEARLRAIRPLIAYYMDPTWILDVPEETRIDTWHRVTAALAEMRALAADAAVRRPTSWQAPLALGAATYLLQPRGSQSMSLAEMDTWEVPLLRAAALAPNRLEPASYLTIAYVQNWQGLRATKRREARPIVQRAFHDSRTFNLVIDHWLRLVPDRREALAMIPDEPFAWRKLASTFRRQGEWARYLDASERSRAAEDRRIDEALEEAEARVAGGDYRKGTSMFHGAAAALEPDARNLQQLERILGGMPAGPVSSAAARNLQAWLGWALRIGFVREQPLEPEHLRRLVGAARTDDPEQEALAHLMVGDLAAAERIERRHTSEQVWDRFQVEKAAALIERGELEAAELALLKASRSLPEHPTYLRVSRALAEARQDTPRLEATRRTEATLPAGSWRGSQMTWDAGVARLTVVPDSPAGGLEIELLDLPARGRPVEVVWNGESVARSFAFPGETLRIQVPIEPEPSLLELRSADRRPLVPGEIALIPAE